MVQMIGIIIIILIAHRWQLVAEKRAVFHSHVVNGNQMKLSEINNVDMMYAENQMYVEMDIFAHSFIERFHNSFQNDIARTINEKGCVQAGEEWVERNLIIISSFVIFLAFLQVCVNNF